MELKPYEHQESESAFKFELIFSAEEMAVLTAAFTEKVARNIQANNYGSLDKFDFEMIDPEKKFNAIYSGTADGIALDLDEFVNNTELALTEIASHPTLPAYKNSEMSARHKLGIEAEKLAAEIREKAQDFEIMSQVELGDSDTDFLRMAGIDPSSAV